MKEIDLKPFTFRETKLFFKERNYFLSDKDIFLYYLCFRSTPHYLTLIDISLSFEENIKKTFFKYKELRHELDNQCAVLFKNNHNYNLFLKSFQKPKPEFFPLIKFLNLLKD